LRKLMRQREDHVHIGNVQEFLFTIGEPPVTRVGLALSAMAVSASNGELSITCVMGSLF
jgi:hypothetical protein